MLLELYDLYSSLEQAKILAERTDDHLVPYPKRPLFYVDLDREGHAVAIRPVPEGDVPWLRKYETSKGGSRESTPGFNVGPLFKPASGQNLTLFKKDVQAFRRALDKGAITTPGERHSKLEGLLARGEQNWGEDNKAINKSLRTAAAVLLDRLVVEGEPQPPEATSICELLRRSKLLDAGKLHAQLLDIIRRQIREAPAYAPMSMLVGLLFAEPSVLILDLADSSGYPFPPNSKRVWDWINHHLLQKPVEGSSSPSSRIGVFGEPFSDDGEKMPQRRLPRLGSVILRSMSDDLRCQARYGLSESAACPIGKALRGDLAASLEWLTHADREGRTWVDVSRSCGFDKPALLLAYPANLPAEPPHIAGFLAGPAENEKVRQEGRFELEAQTLAEGLRGLVNADPNTNIHVLVLAKADKARTKLLCSRHYRAQRVLQAAEEWQRGARNIPEIRIRQFGEQKGKVVWQQPFVPYPAEVVWCLNTVWQRGATHADRVSALSIGDGLSLLLETEPPMRSCATRALSLVLSNSFPLLLALGQAHQLGLVLPLGPKLGKQALLLPSILGILLARLGSWKGEYVHTNAYLIGRLLSIADRIHFYYCQVVRRGQIPPQLLGNSLLSTALENPVSGLARLSERLPLYYGVAESPLRYQAADVERGIDKTALATTSTEMDKAQMILGYLARPDVEPATETVQPAPFQESPHD